MTTLYDIKVELPGVWVTPKYYYGVTKAWIDAYDSSYVVTILRQYTDNGDTSVSLSIIPSGRIPIPQDSHIQVTLSATSNIGVQTGMIGLRVSITWPGVTVIINGTTAETMFYLKPHETVTFPVDITVGGAEDGIYSIQLQAESTTASYFAEIPIDITSCPAGTSWDFTRGQCVSVCSSNQHWDNSLKQCVDNTCPTGQHWDATQNRCVNDEPSHQCPSGQHWDSSTSQCVDNATPTCPSGQHFDATQNKCVADTEPPVDWTIPILVIAGLSGTAVVAYFLSRKRNKMQTSHE